MIKNKYFRHPEFSYNYDIGNDLIHSIDFSFSANSNDDSHHISRIKSDLATATPEKVKALIDENCSWVYEEFNISRNFKCFENNWYIVVSDNGKDYFFEINPDGDNTEEE